MGSSANDIALKAAIESIAYLVMRAACYVQLLLHTAALVVQLGPTPALTAFIRRSHWQTFFHVGEVWEVCVTVAYCALLREKSGFCLRLLV